MMLDFLRNFSKRPYVGSAKQIGFIVGTGRCGTTILAQVLNSHSKICIPHELQIILGIGNGDRFYEKHVSGEMTRYKAADFIKLVNTSCPYRFELFFDFRKHFEDLKYPQTDLRKLLTELFDHICFDYKKEVFLEQTPWYGQRLSTLKQIFPEMKVIHIFRDGRDVAVSFSRTPWWSKDISRNLLQWEKEINAIHEYGARHPENFLEIRYEDLVLAPEAELARALALFGLEFETSMLDPDRLIDYSLMFKGNFSENQSQDFKKWADGKNKIFFPESVYAWKRKEREEFRELPESVKSTLKKFQYEIND